MEVTPIRQPLYTKADIKREAGSAAVSAGLSAGLTLALNGGRASMKTAGKVGVLAAGLSLVIGLAQRLVQRGKETRQLEKECLNIINTSKNTTQG